jgi:hypothetical protein
MFFLHPFYSFPSSPLSPFPFHLLSSSLPPQLLKLAIFFVYFFYFFFFFFFFFFYVLYVQQFIKINGIMFNSIQFNSIQFYFFFFFFYAFSSPLPLSFFNSLSSFTQNILIFFLSPAFFFLLSLFFSSSFSSS